MFAWAIVETADPSIRLLDVSANSGLHLLNVAGDPQAAFIVDSIGNGAALFDYDNDGRLDILLTNGSTRDRLAKGGDVMAALYRNEGGGRFADVTAASGLDRRRGWAMGVCVADVNNDGFPDAYLTALGPNVLWKNNGNGTFTDVTSRAGVDDARWGTSCAFGDYDLDGDVDLYVANYVQFDHRLIPPRGPSANCRFMATDVFCGPNRLPGEPDILYRNDGDGTFTDVTTRSGIVDPDYYGLGVVFTDLDADGWPDIYVANDSVPNLLFRNRGDGTFVEEGLLAGVALSGSGRAQAGMGVDAGDYNGDGLLDLLVTNFSHDHNTLYENGPPGVFTDVSYASGIAATAGPYLGWGVRFVDLDNDGLLDLFIANGHVYPDVDRHGLGTRYRQRNQVFRNAGHRFVHLAPEPGSGLLVEQSSRGAAFGDYDNDGDIDILVVNMHERPSLLRNDTAPTNGWVTFRLVGMKSNRDGLGAIVRLETGRRHQVAEVGGDGSYLSHSDIRAHFGLGSAGHVDRVEIRWPSGIVDTATSLIAGRFYLVVEGQGVQPDPRHNP
ncbi:MAG TPA: CRTAC1 family protein [Vicinamibacterales bacterium]|nr:CRTAC1 family protein [Vicinamibacterales bacterium]